MKRTLPFLAAVMLASWFALPAQAVDGIGVYFEASATTAPCRPSQASGSTFRWYLVARDVSSTTSGISGWECALLLDGGGTAYETSWTIQIAPGATPPGYINIGSGLEFKVGLTQSIPYAPVILLARSGLITYDPDATGQPLKIAVGPVSGSSFGPGTVWPDLTPGPGYALGNDPGQLRRLYPISNGSAGVPYFYWVSKVGGACDIVPSATSSWSEVKKLFK